MEALDRHPSQDTIGLVPRVSGIPDHGGLHLVPPFQGEIPSTILSIDPSEIPIYEAAAEKLHFDTFKPLLGGDIFDSDSNEGTYITNNVPVEITGEGDVGRLLAVANDVSNAASQRRESGRPLDVSSLNEVIDRSIERQDVTAAILRDRPANSEWYNWE